MLRIAELSRAASRSNLAKADRATNLAKQVLPCSRCSAAPVILSRLLRCISREQHSRASCIISCQGLQVCSISLRQLTFVCFIEELIL